MEEQSSLSQLLAEISSTGTRRVDFQLTRKAVAYWPYTDFFLLSQHGTNLPRMILQVSLNYKNVMKEKMVARKINEPSTILYSLLNPSRKGDSTLVGSEEEHLGSICGPNGDCLKDNVGKRCWTIDSVPQKDLSLAVLTVRSGVNDGLRAFIYGGKALTSLSISMLDDVDAIEQFLIVSYAVKQLYTCTQYHSALECPCAVIQNSQDLISSCYEQMIASGSKDGHAPLPRPFKLDNIFPMVDRDQKLFKSLKKIFYKKSGITISPTPSIYYNLKNGASNILLVMQLDKNSQTLTFKHPQGDEQTIFTVRSCGARDMVYHGIDSPIGMIFEGNCYDQREVLLARSEITKNEEDGEKTFVAIKRARCWPAVDLATLSCDNLSNVSHTRLDMQKDLDSKVKALIMALCVRYSLLLYPHNS